MAVKIRLARRGRKKRAMYDIVVADARSPRDGRFIEKLGTYNPTTNPASINISTERSVYWLMVGAQPTDTANAILRYKGILFKKHLQVGVVKGAITQEAADAQYAEFVTARETKVQGKVDGLATQKADARKAALAAEAKVNATRAEAIAAKNAPVVEEAPVAEEAAEEAVEAAAEEATEAPAAEATEAPAE
jgi:small subunit ribosomal protein S16